MTHMEGEMEKMGPPAEEKQNEEAFQEEAVGEDDAEEAIDGEDKGEHEAVDEEEQMDGDDKGEGDAVDEEEQIDGDDKGEGDAVDEEEQMDGDEKEEGDAVDEEEQIDGDDKEKDDAVDEEEKIDGDEKEEADGDHAGQEGSDDIEKKEEAIPLAADESEENMKLPVQPQEKKSSEGLNLNNEVVRMRKEVKRVRVLILRKLTRHLGTLKKKKGKDTEMERNQRRAARLLEEIHALTALSPDVVTKAALQKNLNFEEECKNPKATISDRAIARIATHPQFNKKIQDIKAAVKTFKEERVKGGKQPGKEKVQNKARKVVPQPPDKKRGEKSEKVEDISVMKKKIIDKKEGDGIFKDTAVAKLTETGNETEKATNSADIVGERKEMPESKNVQPAICSKGKNIVQSKPPRSNLKSAPEELQKKKDVEDSDLESSDDEDKKKEYFDDSTEERFHKKSSQSEQSDDDFFIGKVSKFKKKKKQKSTEGEKSHDVNMDPTDNVQSKLDEPEARMKSKATSLQSVFCSLSASKPGSGRGRGGDGFRGRGKPRGGGSGPRGDFNKQSNFLKQGEGTETNSFSKFSKSDPKGFHSGGRGRGRGRGDATRQNDRMGGGVFSHQATRQALHPSWEASKKRKEQQGHILPYQGKKIKFDDDD